MTLPIRALAQRFDPRRFGDIALWLDAMDASSITLSGSNVSQWNDKSGFGRHASQSTGANQPVYSATSLSGLPGISADNQDRFLNTPSFSLDDPLSVYAVSLFNTVAGYQRLLHGQTNGDVRSFFGALDDNFATFFGNGTNWNDVAANSPSTSIVGSKVLAVVNDGSLATPYVNGTAQNTKTGTMGQITTGVRVFGYPQGEFFTQSWNGAAGEIIVYSRAHSTTEARAIINGLRAKWKI